MQLCIIYFCPHSIHFKEFIWNTFTESHFENVLKVVLLLLFIFVSLHLFSKHSFLYSIYSYCKAQRPLLYDRYSFGLRYNYCSWDRTQDLHPSPRSNSPLILLYCLGYPVQCRGDLYQIMLLFFNLIQL